MATITVELKNRKALSILEGMEKAGLISLSLKKKRSKSLAQRLRCSITGLRAKELIYANKKQREEWEERF